MKIGPLGYSRRPIVVVNQPDLVRQVLADPEGIFPKTDLMVHALEPLIGDSIFVSSGATWQRQREMIDPALSMMRVNRAFPAMEAGRRGVRGVSRRSTRATATPFCLDLAMSHLTADIICRTVFSTTLRARGRARRLRRLHRVRAQRRAGGDPPADLGQGLDQGAAAQGGAGGLRADPPPPRRDAARRAPRRRRRASTTSPRNVIAARDPTAPAFTREELIDQLGVLFLAGHETSASALTWVFSILATQPDMVARLRAEVARVAGERPDRVRAHQAPDLHAQRLPRDAAPLPADHLPAARREGGHADRRRARCSAARWSWSRPGCCTGTAPTGATRTSSTRTASCPSARPR